MPSDTLDHNAQGLRIWLLGEFRVAVGSRILAEAEWRLRKARSLIKLLALAPNYRLHREQVMELLWPDQELQAAANSLHQTLHVVRRILAPGAAQRAQYLHLQDERLTLCPATPLWVDVAAFEAAAAQARQHHDLAPYHVALDLYTGDLLPDDRYEEWASVRREALRQEYFGLLRELAQLAEARADYALASETLRRALVSDPIHEEVHRGLMRLYALAGQRQQALRQYQLLQEALRRELDVEPDPRSQRLYQDILAGHVLPSEPAPETLSAPVAAPTPTATEFGATEPPAPSNLGSIRPQRSGQPLPAGTVTFLFTDIEGSTALWEQHTETMHRALAQHDTILRAAIETHAGVVFKTAGDGVHAAFARAPDALAAALAAQQALVTEAWGATGPLRVRMALHTGSAEERDGDYFGPPLNRVARLLAAGHGGQILLSRVTQALAHEELPPHAALRDLGVHQLKDLRDPEQIFQLVTPDLPTDFPPLTSIDSPHNLPAQLTSFIGREREIAEVQRHLSTTRLLTLAGPGGCGKTRLALAAAADALTMYRDGVWLVELAALADPTLVPQTVATALGVLEVVGQPLTEALTTYLKPRQLLLVLDNCEHQVIACGRLAETLLRACPLLRILATSREPLHVPGEMIWLVPSLSLPASHQLPPLEDLVGYEAIRLFVDRALAVLPTFRVTEQNAPATAQVCAWLDGLPLAIELAAARMPVLTVEQLAGRLDDCFRLLTQGSRTALTRQQTLRATLDWSYALLSEQEHILFRRLAVFAGGWSLEAAEAICAGAGLEPDDVLDVLSHLVAKSLVVMEEQGAAATYRMLETVRQYGAEKLREAGEVAWVRSQHLDFFLLLAEEADRKILGAERAVWLTRLEREHDNLRASLAWSQTDAGDVQKGLRLAAALFWFWSGHSAFSEARSWFERLLTRAETAGHTQARAKALYVAGELARFQGDHATARVQLEESVALGRALGETQDLANALRALGLVALAQGDYAAARALCAESVALFREAQDAWHLALSLYCLGDATIGTDLMAARALYEESLALYRKQGDTQGAALPLTSLGRWALQQGEMAAAQTLYEESLAIQQAVGNKWLIAIALNSLGDVARCQGDYARAIERYTEALALARELGTQSTIAWSLHNLGAAALAQGDAGRAVTYFAESIALERDIGSTPGIARSLAGLAGVAGAQGQPERAARLFGAVGALLEAIGTSLEPADHRAYARDVDAIRIVLGADAFAAPWAAGRAMTLEQAIAEALPP